MADPKFPMGDIARSLAIVIKLAGYDQN